MTLALSASTEAGARLCALADVAWGSPERDPADFVQRLGDHLRRLDALGVGYRKP